MTQTDADDGGMMGADNWEAAITVLLLTTFAVPVAYLTPLTPTYAGLLGVLVIGVLNIAYWKWRDVPIREVYSLE